MIQQRLFPNALDRRGMLTCKSMYKDSCNFRNTLLLLLALLPLIGCRQEPKNTGTPTGISLSGCRGCHDVISDTSHDLACTLCHSGNDGPIEKKIAHAGLMTQPSHPDNMATACGPCHENIVENVANSLHLTLKNKINLVRKAFGAKTTLSSLTKIPAGEVNDNPLTLADDLLRRRCLRCHLYSAGDTYPETHRGTGCAACHQSHPILRQPGDNQCLSCHYGNRVGADYAGRFEQDLNWEYRTPFVTFADHPRPYGVEYQPLSSDIHAQAGLSCIDCHTGAELMAGKKESPSPQTLSCLTCHDVEAAKKASFDNLEISQDQVFLITKFTGKKLAVPQLLNEAHKKYAAKADCVVCHAQWVFSDQGVSLLRLDNADLDTWDFLAVQGSSSVETAMEQEGSPTPTMPDTITGEIKKGIWLKSYMQRRWEFPLVGKDINGRLRLYRPTLDLNLSYVNQDGETVIDGFSPVDAAKLRPYSPHTIGRAGLFYKTRLKPNLASYFKPMEQP